MKDMASKTSRRERNLPKGLLAGVIGGIAGAAVILVAEEIFPPSEAEKPSGQQTQHWTLGAVAGGIYGAAAELEPSLAAWRGVAFGLAVNRFANESFLPRMGLIPPPEAQSTQTSVSHWISHAAYGIATDAVRRIVRRLL